jgi:hypothetical protein
VSLQGHIVVKHFLHGERITGRQEGAGARLTTCCLPLPAEAAAAAAAAGAAGVPPLQWVPPAPPGPLQQGHGAAQNGSSESQRSRMGASHCLSPRAGAAPAAAVTATALLHCATPATPATPAHPHLTAVWKHRRHVSGLAPSGSPPLAPRDAGRPTSTPALSMSTGVGGSQPVGGWQAKARRGMQGHAGARRGTQGHAGACRGMQGHGCQ